MCNYIVLLQLASSNSCIRNYNPKLTIKQVLNPAVGMGIDIQNSIHTSSVKANALGYVALEAVGAAAAVGLFKTVRPSEYDGKKLMP